MTIPISLDFKVCDTLGRLYIGNVIAAMCYGITVIQTYIFLRRRIGDSTTLKCLVLVLWMLDSLHIAFISHAVYTYAVKDFASPLTLLIPTWSMMAQVIVAGISDLIVRGYFCRIVFRLSDRNWYLSSAIVVTSLLSLATSLAFAAKGLSINTWIAFSKLSWIVYTNLASSVASDVFIAASLCFLLKKHRTGFTQTDSVLRVLMLYTINTCALTSICTIVCLIVYAATPALNFTYAGIYFVLPTLLLNSLLATLNARKGLRQSISAAVTTIPSFKARSLRPPAETRSRDELSQTCSNAVGVDSDPFRRGD
ncbi:hypothetical protein BKA93DRAFT_106248 [Sparassis latifolia]